MPAVHGAPSPVMRTAWKMASHSRSTAAPPPGNTRSAQAGMGMEAMHQGKPLAICRRLKSFRAWLRDRWLRTIRSPSTPLRFSGSVAEMAR